MAQQRFWKLESTAHVLEQAWHAHAHDVQPLCQPRTGSQPQRAARVHAGHTLHNLVCGPQVNANTVLYQFCVPTLHESNTKQMH